MARVQGIGGIFFKSKNPTALAAWYAQHLGVPVGAGESMGLFQWRQMDVPEKEQMTVWSPFPADTDYFQPSSSSFMVNYIVDDIDSVLEELKAEGVEVEPNRDDSEYGRFAWIIDPDGNKIELWQPPTDDPANSE